MDAARSDARNLRGGASCAPGHFSRRPRPTSDDDSNSEPLEQPSTVMPNHAPTTLTILLEHRDLLRAREAWPDTDSGRILALDPDLHAKLLAQAVEHLTPWELVGADDWPALRALEAAGREFWEAAASAPYGGLDLFRVAPFRHEEWIARCTWLAFVLERAFSVCKPHRVRIVHQTAGHGLTAPPGVNHYPPLPGLAQFLAERHGCEFRITEPAATGHFSSADESPARAGKLELADLLPAEPYVLFYANHVDLRHQLSLIRELRAKTGLEAVQVFKTVDTATRTELEAAGHRCLHEDQLSAAAAALWPLKSPPGRVREMSRTARQRFAIHGGLRPAALFDNPWLASHFDFLFGPYLRKMAWNVDLWRGVFELCPPALLIVSDQLPVAAAAERMGVPVLSLPHGLMVGETNWNSRLTPTIGALTPWHRELLVKAGVAKERVRVTGSPGLDCVLEKPPVCATNGNGAGCAQRTILVCTSNFGLLAKLPSLPRMNWKCGLELMQELMELPGRHPDWRLVIKAHPRFDHAQAYRLLAGASDCSQRVQVVTEEPLDELTANADAVVFPNPLTSSLIETSRFGRPTYLLRGAMIEYDAGAWALDGWAHCGNVAELEAVLERDFSDPAYYERAAGQTRAALAGFLGNDRRSAAECMVEMAVASANEQRGRREAGAENRFVGNTQPVLQGGGIDRAKIHAVPYVAVD